MMARKGAKQGGGPRDVATEQFELGAAALRAHPLFAPLLGSVWLYRREGADNLCPQDGWAVVTTNGWLHVHPKRRAEPAEWTYVLAHCLLHLGFGHLDPLHAKRHTREREWNAACCAYVARFLGELKLGQAPEGLHGAVELPAATEERLYEIFCERGIPETLQGLGAAGPQAGDLAFAEPVAWAWRKIKWGDLFAAGLAQA